MGIASINPANGEVISLFEAFSDSELESRLAGAASAFNSHRLTSFSDRSRKMVRAADVLETDQEKFARMMTLEMGKPIQAARQEVDKCAWACRFYAENAEQFLSDETVKSSASKSCIKYQPIGPVLAVMPWNFPFWQVFRFAAPAIMAGNVGLLKHSSNVPQSALAIEEVFARAGFDQFVFQTLLIESSQVEKVLSDERIVAATLTGSEPAGSAVAATCGRLIKKTVLELGGSDPFIVMPSADVEQAAKTGVTARTINNGQSCIAAKRFIVHADVFDRFVEQFISTTESLKVGDPFDEGNQIGPLATRDVLESLDEQVQKSVQAGARILTGGKKISGPGNYYLPTVLTEIPKDSPAYSEELFGPVALLFKVGNIDEAIRIANDSPFGLGSSVWTAETGEIDRFTADLEAGSVFVNSMVASDPRLPFGGVKHSGYGRELAAFGIREFVNIKTISIK